MKTLWSLLRQLEKGNANLPQRVQGTRPFSPNQADDRWSQFGISPLIQAIHPPLMAGLVIVSLTGVVGYRFYNQPQLAIGTLAPETIRAPRNERIEDSKSTAQRRKEAQLAMVPILKRDPEVTVKLKRNLTNALNQITLLRQKAQPFPFISTQILPLKEQQIIRSLAEKDWQTILASLERIPIRAGSLTPTMNTVATRLQAYRQKISPAQWTALLHQITLARQHYAQVHLQLSLQNSQFFTPETIVPFLALSEPNWQKAQQVIQDTAHTMLTQGLVSGIPPTILTETLNLQLDQSLPLTIQPAATNLLLAVLQNQSNLVVDQEATQRQAEEVAQAVEPMIIEIQKGEVIVEAGKKIAPEEFILLDYFGLSRRGINWLGLGASTLLVTGSVWIFLLVAKRFHSSMRRRDHILLYLLSLSTSLLAITDLRYMNLPSVGLLTSSFYSPTLAVTQVLLLSGLEGFAAQQIRWEHLLAGMAGGVLASVGAGRMRSRDELALLGGGVGLLQGGVYFLVSLLLIPAGGIIWYKVLLWAMVYGLLGIAWVIVALGISPYLERLFDVVTPIRLVELANPNCPLLKRLATETPGTFQHTLFVACLAEAAARELRCNVELVRAGTLYHDIGKMHDPLGFIENQMGRINKHDVINDPYVSVDIIKKHVTEGLVMAKRYGLPRVIRAFIPEHQGTLLISYFYHLAQQKAEQEGKDEVLEAIFHYDGPIPQSRETGLVMLADGCEAALRSLKEATPEIALVTIKKIFQARWRDNQLQDSGLKYEELPVIAEIFVKVWQQFHHQRIAYPKAALEPAIQPIQPRITKKDN